MKILVINAGSSSIKYKLYDMETEEVLAKGGVERIGIEGSKLVHVAKTDKPYTVVTPIPDHVKAMQLTLDALTDPEHGAVRSVADISAVGHRIVQGGSYFKGAALLTPENLERVRDYSDLAPLHNPAAVMGIEACQKIMPDTPMAAVFDTAFHQTMPDYAYMYALPYEYHRELRVRRYGMHGTSHKYVAGRAAKLMGQPVQMLKIVTCHLGNGASIAAVKHGKSIDTSMGMTPLAGIMMGTRAGDIDPALAGYIMDKTGMDIHTFTEMLNKESGLYGISGLSSDMRDITAAAESGHARAKLALEMFCYHVRKYIGAYAVAMGGLDCVVITAGIGENTPLIRTLIAQDMDFLGLACDESKNNRPAGNYIISPDGAKVTMCVVATDEEKVIALETQELLAE